MFASIRNIVNDLRVNEPPKAPKFSPGGKRKNYDDVEAEVKIRREIEKEFGTITNDEFTFAMDKHHAKHGYYPWRDYKWNELNNLTSYIDEYRRTKGGRR